MTDLEKMVNTLKVSGKVEDVDFDVITVEDTTTLTIYKAVFIDWHVTEDIEFHFEYDTEGNLKEAW